MLHRETITAPVLVLSWGGLAVWAFSIWLVGYRHRRERLEPPSLWNRIENCFLVPFLSYFLVGLSVMPLIMVIGFFVGEEAMSAYMADEKNRTTMMQVSQGIFLPVWLLAGRWMWQAFTVRWPLNGKVLMLPFWIMMAGAYMKIVARMLKFSL